MAAGPSAKGRQAPKRTASDSRSAEQRRQDMRRPQRRGGAKYHLAVGGPNLEHRIGKRDQPATPDAARLPGRERDLIEAALRERVEAVEAMDGGRWTPQVLLHAVKPNHRAVVRIARDPVGEPQRAVGR